MPTMLGTSVSALTTYQRALTTASHNIANVNTDGYSRQRVELGTRPPEFTGAGYFGSGVETTAVMRSYSAILAAEVRTNTSDYSRLEEYSAFVARIDNLLADERAGLSSAMENFFAAAQDVASDPSHIPSRQVLLTEAESVSNRFQFIDERLNSIEKEANRQVDFYVDEIDAMAESIAELNIKIKAYSSQGVGNLPNDLLDERDLLLEKMSDLVGVQITTQSDYTINVFVGSGQALVVGGVANNITTQPNLYNPGERDIVITGVGGAQNITNAVTGGRLGGLLDFRDQILEDARTELGRVAQGLAETFNAQHRLGMDLNDNLGQDFFSLSQPQVLPDSTNGGTATITTNLTDVSQLEVSNYRISYNGADWLVTRLSDNTVTNLGAAPGTVTVDGVDLTFGGVPNAGDSFLLRPSASIASSLQVVVDNVDEIAAAAPISTGSNSANTGSGAISAGVVIDTTNAAFTTTPQTLTPPVMIQFTAANTYDVYDYTNPGAPVLLEAGIAYNPATGGAVFPTPGALDYGYRIDLSGSPAVGDEFTVGYNNGGVGDNRNMVLMADIQRLGILDGGNATLNESYVRNVAEVGSEARRADIDRDAQESMLKQAEDNMASVSGVNLDEEAANLIKYQQAYQASARIITVAQQIFDSLIAAV